MDTVNSVAERVHAIVEDKLAVEAEAVTPAARFVEDLSADSLDLADLWMAIAEEFDVEIPIAQCATLTTVGDAVRYLQGRLVDA